MRRGLTKGGLALCLTVLSFVMPAASWAAGESEAVLGPYSATFLQGGVGIERPLDAASPLLAANAPWSMSAWVRTEGTQEGDVVLVSIGDPEGESCRIMGLLGGKLFLSLGGKNRLETNAAIPPEEWHAIAVTYDGNKAKLYLDGKQVSAGTSPTEATSPVLHIAPAHGERHFGGSISRLQIRDYALPEDAVERLFEARPDADAETPPADKAASDAPQAEKPQAEKSATDKPQADPPASDKPQTDKPQTDKPADDKAQADKPQADQPAGDKPQADKPEANEPQADHAVIDKPQADKAATDKPPS